MIWSGGNSNEKLLIKGSHQNAETDGWYEVNVEGGHHQYKHPTKKGRTTVKHPDKDIPLKTLKRIEEQSGLKFI